MERLKITLKNLYEKIKKNTGITALFFLGTSLIIFGLSAHSFVFDEVFSLYASRNFSEMTKILWEQEANMWFYYLILHLWQKLGTSEFIIRSLSGIIGSASLVVFWHVAKKLFGKKVALISVFLMLINVYFIITAQLARGYILSLFFTLVSMYIFTNFDKKGGKVLYVISTALSVYTHFYAGFIFLSQILFAILTKKFKIYRLSFLTISILLSPILLSPSIHSHQVDWIVKPTLRNLVGTSFVFAGDYPPLLVIYSFLFIFLIPRLVENLRNPKYKLILLWLITPVLTSFLISVLFKPIFQSVYFLTSLPPFVILAGLAIKNISKKHIKYLMLSTIFILSILRLSLWYRGDTRYKWVFRNNEDDFRHAVSLVNREAKEGDVIAFYGYNNRLPYEFYSARNKLAYSERNKLVYSQKDTPKVLEISTAAYDLGGGSRLPEPNLNLLTDLDNKRVWLLVKYSDRGFLDRDEQVLEIKMALAEKYQVESVYEFPGLQLVLYVHES